jgi:MoxR-like ATPase
MPPPDPGGAAGVLDALAREVVGLRREAEVLAVALETGRHVVLEGPPGSGKSTLLRGLSRLSARRVLFVEGNAELTPARLVGGFDPALVLEAGYSADTFLEGPLIEALRGDGWLYVEELNRVPEETLNVLVTVLAEGELHVPRLGRIPAGPGFRLVAAMNPFDAIGTARVSQAIADRLCRIAIRYQDEDAERRIVEQVTGRAGDVAELMVALVRASREHADLRIGASVRAAIDATLLADGLQRLRGEEAPSRATLLDAAVAALSGRITLEDGSARTAEEIVAELLDRLLTPPSRPERDDDRSRSAPDPPAAGAPPGGAGATPGGNRHAGRPPATRTYGRELLAALHDDFEAVSPAVGSLDLDAFEALMGSDSDAALALLHDLARATDPVLRARARRLAAQLSIGLARAGTPRRAGVRRLVALPGGRQDGDLDLERTVERLNGRRPPAEADLVVRSWRGARRSLALLVDHSGSMRGRALALAGVSSAAMMVAAEGRARCSVIAFAGGARVLQDAGRPRSQHAVLDDLLGLHGGGLTNLADALRAAAAQLRAAPPGGRVAIALSDCLATAGREPADALDGIDCLHVLGTSAEPDAVRAGRALSRRAGGRFVLLESVAAVPRQIAPLLAS